MEAFTNDRPALQEITSPVRSLFWQGNVDTRNGFSFLSNNVLDSPEEQIIQQRTLRMRAVVEHWKKNGCQDPDTDFLVPSRRLSDVDERKRTSTEEINLSVNKRRRLSLPTRSSSPLPSQLLACSLEQVIGVFQKLLNKHPELEQEIKEALPAPDLGKLENELVRMRRQVLRNLPTNRFGGTSRDANAYARVRPHMIAFRNTCAQQVGALVEGAHYNLVILYVLVAWRQVQQFPTWDIASHNGLVRQCYRTLASHCMIALRKGSFSIEFLQQIKPKLRLATVHNEEIQTCLQIVDQMITAQMDS